MLSADDYWYFLDDALNGMVAIVTELGDVNANQRPDLPGANSPYAILTHCLGVMEYWGGHVVAGRPSQREREAEFRAAGPVAELVGRARRARGRLAEDVAGLQPAAAPRGSVGSRDRSYPPAGPKGVCWSTSTRSWPNTGAKWRSRDLLRAPWARLA